MDEGKLSIRQSSIPESTKNDPKDYFFRFKQWHIFCAIAL